MKKRLITSALPYVNNVPHLGNLIQVLSADVFARFCRSRGYVTMYVCGTDEYGTATETKAKEEGVSPRELCDRYHALHTEIYEWFNINFDSWGRTSTDKQTEIVQDIFKKVFENGYISEQTIEQLYSEQSDMFLADRYVRGECPHCGYDDARGDQCESCGKLLDPSDLINPRSAFDNSVPVMKETKHLYLNLPAIKDKLEEWIKVASVEGKWAKNAIKMTEAWIRDGLKERAITRDLKWGIPVPLEGFENKVFYVWFDAPIGYVSITANKTDDWQKWWKNPDEVELFQFIGKDNIPFHTVIFPSSQIGTGEEWTKLHHMSSTEYLNYEDGKFSKSKGVGVFGNDAKDTGIPADVWRFYIFYNRPETSDYVFTWKDFQDKTNHELIGNLGNLVNRTLSFLNRFYDGKVPAVDGNPEFWAHVEAAEKEITEAYEWAGLREGFQKTFHLAGYGNKIFQEAEPWKLKDSDPEKAAQVLRDLVYLLKDLAILIAPVIPETSERILKMLKIDGAKWEDLRKQDAIADINAPEVLFQKLDDKLIASLKERFSGSQQERKDRQVSENKDVKKEEVELTLEEQFRGKVELVVAKITGIERHPEAEKLYIEAIDLGAEEESTIVSGLVPYYTEEELLNRNVILVKNLKPAKLRGVKSHGMLLAAEGDDQMEVVFVDGAEPGTRIVLQGDDPAELEAPKRISIDKFFNIPIKTVNGVVTVGETALTLNGEVLKTVKVQNGELG